MELGKSISIHAPTLNTNILPMCSAEVSLVLGAVNNLSWYLMPRETARCSIPNNGDIYQLVIFLF